MNKHLQSAFVDELEKTAGLPVAVRKGGGGAYGKYRRAQKMFGRRLGKGDVVTLKNPVTVTTRPSSLLGSALGQEVQQTLPAGTVINAQGWRELGRHTKREGDKSLFRTQQIRSVQRRVGKIPEGLPDKDSLGRQKDILARLKNKIQDINEQKEKLSFVRSIQTVKREGFLDPRSDDFTKNQAFGRALGPALIGVLPIGWAGYLGGRKAGGAAAAVTGLASAGMYGYQLRKMRKLQAEGRNPVTGRKHNPEAIERTRKWATARHLKKKGKDKLEGKIPEGLP